MKARSKKPNKVDKGVPSAVLLSILIHAALFLLAGMLVVFTVVKVKEPDFEAPKAVERPKMKLRKPKVMLKKSSKPKSTTRIVTTKTISAMPNIELPEMSGMGKGLGDGFGGFDMMPSLDEVNVFGGGQSIGNDFEGVLYDLKRDRAGGDALMDLDKFMVELRKFCLSGWDESLLSKYWRSETRLYTTHFMVPTMVAPLAPDAFGVPEMESFMFFVKYKGSLVYKEDIKFRFWGMGDAFLVVYVDGKHVLVNGWEGRLEVLDFWQTFDGGSDRYYVGNKQLKVGDWITLKAGEAVDMQLLFGEWRGGDVGAALLVEVAGEEYPTSRQGGPLLPAFKTAEFSQDMLDEIMKNLAEGEADLMSGPVFNDYYSTNSIEPSVADGSPVEAAPMGEGPAIVVEDEPVGLRVWNMRSGRTITAEFMSAIGDSVALKNKKGKLLKLPRANFSEADQEYIQLIQPPDIDIEFSKKSKQRVFPFTMSNVKKIPRSSYYDFWVTLKQTSVGQYDQELTVEFFVIGDEVSGNKHTLLDYQTASFTFNNENDKTFELMGKTVQLLEYDLNDERRGTKYGGHLVLVTDARGKIIAHRTTKRAFYENLENLRKIPVGRYFDRTCTRCTPSRPRPWY